MTKHPPKFYLAHKLTGLKAGEVTTAMKAIKKVLKDHGILYIDPWDKEKHLYKETELICAGTKLLDEIWFGKKGDKKELLACHGVIDVTGALWSKGTSVETAISRFSVHRPTIIMSPEKDTVRNLEYDIVIGDIYEVAELINRMWGTRIKRILWRLVNVWSPMKVWNRFIRELQGWR